MRVGDYVYISGSQDGIEEMSRLVGQTRKIVGGRDNCWGLEGSVYMWLNSWLEPIQEEELPEDPELLDILTGD